jgi:hypothetical protein
MNRHFVIKTVSTLACAAFAMVWGARANTLVYQNTNTTSSARFNPGTIEVGDEITLGPGPRVLSTFTFEYWGTNFSGDETLTFTLYENDGPPTNTFATPLSVLYTETFGGPINLPATDKASLTFNLLSQNITLPDEFTWAVQFGGIDSGEAAGLSLTDTDPSVGSSHTDYWDNDGGWNIRTNTNPAQHMNFAAEIYTQVPEPGTVALAALGGFALLFMRLRRS